MTSNIKWAPTYSSGNIAISNNGTGSTGLTYTSTWAPTEMKPSAINVNGDAVFHGNIEWQGRDMREWFARVESRLGMLQTNPKLEQDWKKLQDLRMQYVELERELLEKQRIFDILKKP